MSQPDTPPLSDDQQAMIASCAAVLEFTARRDDGALRKLLDNEAVLARLDHKHAWPLWLATLATAPEHAERLIRIWGAPGDQAAARLETLLTIDATWARPHLMDTIIEVADGLGGDVAAGLMHQTIDTLLREHLDPTSKEKGALSMLVHLMDQHGQDRWSEDPAQPLSSNLIAYAVKLMEIDEHRRGSERYSTTLKARGEKLIEELTNRNVDMERAVRMDGLDAVSALHVAALHHDDWGGMEVAMALLMNAGANAKRVLDILPGTDGAIEPNTRALLEDHPARVRERLLAGRVDGEKSGGRRL